MNMKKNSRVFSDNDPLSMVRRSMLYACGWTHDEIQRPLIAVVNTYNEMHPGHMHLKTLAERVKAGVRTAGGLPTEFYALSLCDGLANGHEGMKFVLPSRQVIADSVELGLRAHCYDAAVLIGSCDKILPALLIAAARVNIPSIVVAGGPMPAGYWAREKVRASVSNVGSIMRKVYAGDLSKEIREEALSSLYPCAGACWGMGTANTMACLCEALGMSLPGDGTAPGLMAKKSRLAEQAGEKIMYLLKEDITPKKIMTRQSLENAVKVNLAIGGSLNSVLHLPALAHELDLKIDYSDFDRLSGEIPHLTNIEPAGPYSVIEFDEAGGVPGLMKTMGKLLDGTSLTVTGDTLDENLKKAEVFDPEVIRPRTNPVHPYGGIAVLKGNLAAQGALIKQVAVKNELWKFTGQARVFDSEEEALDGLGKGLIKKGEVIVIRYEGPKGGPGMREMALFRVALKFAGMGQTNYIVTDGRFSGYSDGPSIGYLCPEAADGGTIALVKDGDLIEIDIEKRIIDLKVPEQELQLRKGKLVPPVRQHPKGYLDVYKKMVSSADLGAVIDIK
jgi:dihydroxy-acid dehydratase